MSNYDIEVVFHHEGKFVNDGSFRYHGGDTSNLIIDLDRWSYFEILAILKEMGYRNVKEMWYSLGGSVLEDRLDLLSDDKGACEVVNIAQLNGQAHLFVVHMVSDLVYIHMLEYDGEAQVCEHGEKEDGEVQVGEEGKEQPVDDGEGQVHEDNEEVVEVGEEGEKEVGELGQDAEVEVGQEAEEEVGQEGQEEVVEVGLHGEEVEKDVVEEVGDGTAVCEHGVHEVGEEDDGQDDVGGGVGDGHDEFDVSSWIGSDEDACLSEDDLVDVSVYGDEEPQEGHCEGSLFVDVGTKRGSNSEKKHVLARGLSDIEWESDTCGSIDLSDDSDHEPVRYGDFGIFSEPSKLIEYTMVGSQRFLRMTIEEYTSNVVVHEGNIHGTHIVDIGLLRSNPGSTVKLNVEPSEDKAIFKRMYVCFKACKDNFVSCKYEGELLTAVGRNGNDQICPLAYVVVEVENKDTWTWFLELLIDDLGGGGFCSRCTFVSDQQKVRLRQALQGLFPGVDQRFCVRHIYSNFRKNDASNQGRYEDAFKHLISIPPRQVLKLKMLFHVLPTCHPRCKGETNDNDVGRDLYIPDEENELEKTKYWILKYDNYYHALVYDFAFNYWMQIFEICHTSNIGEKYVVNVEKRDCSCRKWTVTGIPCCHAITTMRFLNNNPEDFISLWFKTSTYGETYNPIIFPLNGPHLWQRTSYPDILPPPKRVLPGSVSKMMKMKF
ncbi:hypothetical protein V8G54_003815 [Vigna mungo]|uniref:SWIM-type domain-containing protein n=1 Tax=Vigna mungo TaxID=3915 RepID=A0AAQ3PAN9_VIGMU